MSPLSAQRAAGSEVPGVTTVLTKQSQTMKLAREYGGFPWGTTPPSRAPNWVPRMGDLPRKPPRTRILRRLGLVELDVAANAGTVNASAAWPLRLALISPSQRAYICNYLQPERAQLPENETPAIYIPGPSPHLVRLKALIGAGNIEERLTPRLRLEGAALVMYLGRLATSPFDNPDDIPLARAAWGQPHLKAGLCAVPTCPGELLGGFHFIRHPGLALCRFHMALGPLVRYTSQDPILPTQPVCILCQHAAEENQKARRLRLGQWRPYLCRTCALDLDRARELVRLQVRDPSAYDIMRAVHTACIQARTGRPARTPGPVSRRSRAARERRQPPVVGGTPLVPPDPSAAALHTTQDPTSCVLADLDDLSRAPRAHRW